MKRQLFYAFAALLAIASCSKIDNSEQAFVPSVKSLDQMSTREKVGQLFNIRIESLFNGEPSSLMKLTEEQKTMFQQYPCGGFTLFAKNIDNPEQLTKLTSELHKLANYPIICIDEEGGRVARIGKNSNFNVPTFESMGAIGATGDTTKAYDAGNSIGAYLKQYGLDVDFAPVADVNSNPDNPVIGTRSFSSNPDTAAMMSVNFLRGLRNKGIKGCMKHFPGHGDTKTDTHFGYAESQKTWAEMLKCEMIPFKRGISENVSFIMTAHISTPNVTGNSEPATMSSVIIQDKLRDELGYRGIIITDAMEMGAITSQYSPAEAAVGVILAGVDIVLLPEDYKVAFDAICNAVSTGIISEERLNQSVSRILKFKRELISRKY